MGLVKGELVMFLFLMLALCGLSQGFVYRVGDYAGWTISGNVDYTAWAASKRFQNGDTLIFEYEPTNHNVVQVSRSNFHRCDTTAPIATFATGNDSIVIHGPGHYYFICGFLGHCQAGQKVDIRVPRPFRPTAIPTSSPISGPITEASSIGPMAPGPYTSTAASLNGLFSSIIGLFLVFVYVIFV